MRIQNPEVSPPGPRAGGEGRSRDTALGAWLAPVPAEVAVTLVTVNACHLKDSAGLHSLQAEQPDTAQWGGPLGLLAPRASSYVPTEGQYLSARPLLGHG